MYDKTSNRENQCKNEFLDALLYYFANYDI